MFFSLAFFIFGISVNLSLNAQEQKVMLEQIRENRDNQDVLSQLIPIVHCSFKPNKYEEVLITQLRNKETNMQDFRKTSKQLAGLLVAKVVETLPTSARQIQTPLTTCEGCILNSNINLVSIMRSGDALLDVFISHFPHATVSKVLIQRDERTAKPNFKYMKLSPTLGPDSIVVITEPMIATGGTLSMVISLLKEAAVQEKNIIIASIFTAPEGLLALAQKFPEINVVMTVMDDHLDERKYIVPGLGDFGDRYFGTSG